MSTHTPGYDVTNSKAERAAQLRRDRLIAAAPDLLEALQDIASWKEANSPNVYDAIANLRRKINGWQDRARAAIAKAEGVSCPSS